MLLPELYPFESRYLSIDGLRLHYLDEGQGPPVVMVHGNPTWSFYYRDLIKALRPRYRVIAPDHIGMGLSEKPDDSRYDYTAARHLEDLTRLVDHLALPPFTLVGHDWGGIIGTAYATLHPERIAGMVLMNTAGFNWPLSKTLPLALRLARTPLASDLFIRGLNAFARGAVRMGVKRGRMRAEVAQGLLHPYGTWADRISVHRFVQDIPVRPGDRGYDLALLMESRLRLLRDVPKLFCWGMKDFVFCSRFLAEWLRHFPDAEVRRFEDAGHYVLEDAAAEVIPLVESFLDAKVRGRLRAPAPPPPPALDGGDDLTARLAEQARRAPARLVVAAMKGRRSSGSGRCAILTSAEAERQSSRIAHGLEKVGLRRGARVVVMVTPGTELFAILAALLKMGAIPVLVDPGMGTSRLGDCLAEARPQAFIGVPRAQLGRLLFGWARSSLELVVTVGRRALWGGYTLERIEALGSPAPYVGAERPEPDDVAMLAYTSGNTGPPKGVVYTHRMLSAQIGYLEEAIRAAGLGAHLATFPPFALFAPACGVPAVIPEMDATRPIRVDPAALLAALGEWRCRSTFFSPALIEKLGRHCQENGLRLPHLRLVVSAGAPARLDSLARFVNVLEPGAEVLVLYGATEGLPLTAIGSTELLAETRERTAGGGGVCVGRPVPGVEVAVVPITEDPMPTWSDALRLPIGTIGEIVAKGPFVSPAYLGLPEHDRLAKIHDPRDGRLWHRMGDVGALDDRGRLWMCGRKGHRVVTPERTLFTLPCEARFEAHPEVDRAALVGVTRRGRVEPVICIQPVRRLGRAARRRLAAELLALAAAGDPTRDVHAVLFHPRFPVDVRHNAKIAREQLARWAQGKVR